MEISRIADLRPRFVWDIIDDAFDLYRERFLPFLAISAVAYVPLRLADFAITELVVKPATHGDDATTRLIAAFCITLPIQTISKFLVLCAVTEAVETQLNGREPEAVGTVYRKVFKRLGSLIGAILLVAFLETFGILTAGILTIYVSIVTSFVVQAILIEKRKLSSALSRSYQLANADGWRIFGLLTLTGLITSLLIFGVQGITQGAYALISHGSQHAAAQASQQQKVTETLNAIAAMLLEPVGAIAMTLLYYDLRVRREGIDLVAAADSTGVILAPDPFGDLQSSNVLRDQRRKKPTR